MAKRMAIASAFASCALLEAACTTHPVSPIEVEPYSLSFDARLFGEKPAIVDDRQLFELPAHQRVKFLDFFHAQANQSTAPHERIYDYLLEVTADFDFHSDTRTAAQSLDTASGNCLSLAILTTALARLANVESGYQLVDSTPVFERRGTVISKGIHVRSILYDPTWIAQQDDVSTEKRPGIRFDYFPEATERARLIGKLSADAYVAMYYSNIAGEAIAAGDINSAFWYLLESIEHESQNAIALNMLAIVYRRAGDEAMAERIYQHGIESLPEKVSFFRNYRVLLKGQGRMVEAEKVDRALASLDDRNPFHWVDAGRRSLNEGNYRESIAYLRKALDIAPYLHEAHAWMAVAHLKSGDLSRGERELQRALDNAQRQTTRSLYQAKLDVLGR